MSAATSLPVGNERGVHSRVATRLAEIALDYGVVLRIDRDGEGADCSSILDVLSLALDCGDEVRLQAEGARAAEALAAAVLVLARRDDP